MSPKKKQGDCCNHSQTNFHLKYEATRSEGDHFSQSDYPETILHRLRPRINRQQIASETVYKACGPRKRRKKARLSIKRCFITKGKRRFHKNRNLRVNMSQKSAEDVGSGTVFPVPIQAPDTSAATIPCDANQRIKSTSFIQLVKDYVYSTIKEGTRWATNYVYQTFVGSDNKSEETDRPRKRYKVKNNQRGDGSPENLSGENFENLQSDARRRHSNVIGRLTTTWRDGADNGNGNVSNKMGKKVSQSRRKRTKGGRRGKWIVGDVIRYKKMSRKARERHANVRNGPALVNSWETNPIDMQIIENVNDHCLNNGDVNNFAKKKKEEPVYQRMNN